MARNETDEGAFHDSCERIECQLRYTSNEVTVNTPILIAKFPDKSPETTALDSARLRTILITIAISIITVVAVADRSWSDGRTAVGLTIINSSVMLTHILKTRDFGLVRVLLFGCVLGIVELVADALCVRYTQTLDYSPSHSPMLWLSPWWMPLAWMLVSAQIATLGVWCIERWGLWRGTAITALIGAINIPFYEEMAFHAHWWRYDHCHRLGHTPIYIIVAELLIGLCLAPLGRIALRTSRISPALWAGLLAGLSTIVSGLLGYGLLERVLQ